MYFWYQIILPEYDYYEELLALGLELSRHVRGRVGVSIGVGDEGGSGIQIYSGKFEMIRALKLGEDLF